MQNSAVCVRGTPLPGDTLGPLQSVNSSFINIGEQSTNGVDVSAYFRNTVMGGEPLVGLDYSRMLEFKKRELGADGTSLVSRDLTGEYEYPEDRFVLTGDWGFDAWGVRATLNYTGFEGLTIAVGIDNALDEEPPFAIGDGDSDLYGYVSGMHDPRGQFIYGKVTYRF